MEDIKIIKKAVSRKHPCHEVHKAISNVERNIIDLIEAWNDLPDDIRLSKQLDNIAEVIIKIGDE